jgi:galactose mutarotase-like enzyme
MENAGDQIADWSVWEVAQVDAPDYAALPLNRGGRFSRGYYVFRGVEPAAEQVTLVGREARIRRSPKKGSKIGVDSPEGAIYARRGNLKFIVSATYEPNQEYPDDGCAQEIWTNPDPDKYMELELLSPIQYLQPGEKYTFTTRWRLERSAK